MMSKPITHSREAKTHFSKVEIHFCVISLEWPDWISHKKACVISALFSYYWDHVAFSGKRFLPIQGSWRLQRYHNFHLDVSKECSDDGVKSLHARFSRYHLHKKEPEDALLTLEAI